jgi:hypothetical protein
VQPANANSTINAIALNVIASILYAAAIYAGERFFARTAHSNPSYRRLRLFGFVLLWILVNVGSFAQLSGWWLVLMLTSTTLGVVVFKELDQFWKIGLVGADREVKGGIDYGAALGMCKHSFQFLGIGAAKLTQNQKAFRDAIDRCNRTEPVRLLLSRPDAPELARFAQMAGKNEESYQTTVRESLRFIASLHHKEAKNISVRFYQQFPAFRLMFIDGAVCLMSYYIMGKGDGSNLPQLHIIKTPGAQDTEALYFAFTEYFEKIWNDSKDWNCQEFL